MASKLAFLLLLAFFALSLLITSEVAARDLSESSPNPAEVETMKPNGEVEDAKYNYGDYPLETMKYGEVDDAKHRHVGYPGRVEYPGHGYPGGGYPGRGYPGGGYPGGGYPGGGGYEGGYPGGGYLGGYCRYGCCGGWLYGGICRRCCYYPRGVMDAQLNTETHN